MTPGARRDIRDDEVRTGLGEVFGPRHRPSPQADGHPGDDVSAAPLPRAYVVVNGVQVGIEQARLYLRQAEACGCRSCEREADTWRCALAGVR